MDTLEEEDTREEEEEVLPELDPLGEDGDHPLCPYHKQTKENWWVNHPLFLTEIGNRCNSLSTNGSCIGESTMTMPS